MDTLSCEVSFREEIRKSRFLAFACPVSSPDEVGAFFCRVRQEGATHNVTVFRIGGFSRFHDDGEVSGTAGKPILGVIEKQELDRVAVLVARFFGGVKLGAGGLVRAYAGVASKCLNAGIRQPIREMAEFLLAVPFAETRQVFYLLDRLGIARSDMEYVSDGVQLKICLEKTLAADLEERLKSIFGSDFRLAVMKSRIF